MIRSFQIVAGIDSDKDGNRVDANLADTVLRRVEAAACDTFGGFTRQLGRGGWKNGQGKVVHEDVVIYTIHEETKPGVGGVINVLKMADELRTGLNQAEVRVIMPDGSVIPIPTPASAA